MQARILSLHTSLTCGLDLKIKKSECSYIAYQIKGKLDHLFHQVIYSPSSFRGQNLRILAVIVFEISFSKGH